METSGHALSQYHEATKHSPASIRSSAQSLDWKNKPLPFKIYTSLEGIRPPDDIGRLCLYSNGVLRWRRHRSGEVYGFRAAPCTGALYHIEMYVATAQRPDLPAGLYHYGAHDNALRLLREGDVRGTLLAASGRFHPLDSAPLVFILTSTFWRNSWKYRARAYRHAYWDGGAVLANLLALAAEDRLRTAVVMGFVDAEVNRLLGVDGELEAAVALVTMGDSAPAPMAAGPLAALHLPTAPLSLRMVRYPQVEQAHRASSFASTEEVAEWRAGIQAAPAAVPARLFDAPVEEVIRHRRSTRRFRPGSITRSELETVLARANIPVPGDSFAAGIVEPFLILNAVDGLDRGVYGPGLRSIRTGDFRAIAGEMALGQPLAAQGAANVYFMSDLARGFEGLGERGYRVAQMAGGIAGGRVELSAIGSGLGATGLTFFDDEVTRFFKPAAADRQVMYLAALGHADR
jgi:SagB-type dehydrogenase family enzyme